MTLAEAALLYAERFKRPVFPLAPREKYPIVRRGLKQATTNATTITKWWKRTPNANIGFLCGKGLLVLDVDGPVGAASLAKLEKRFGALPETVEAKTARGRHVFFDVGDRPAVTGSGGLGRGLDTRGDDSYIVAPPSVHPSGKIYTWVRHPGTKLAKAPRWILKALEAPPQGTAPEGRAGRGPGYLGDYRPADTSRSGVDLALTFKLIREGWSDDDIADELMKVSEKAADYGDPASYVARTVAFARGAHEAGRSRARVKGVWLQRYGARGSLAAMARVRLALAVEGLPERVMAHVVVPTEGHERAREVYDAVLGDVPAEELVRGRITVLRGVLGRELDVAVRGGVVRWMKRVGS